MALTGLTAVNVSPPLEIELSVTPDLESLDDAIESITLEHGEATVRGARRTTLYAQWWRPCGPPRGAVAIVHGLKDHSARYGAFAERLVRRGFAVHAFDLRGHARSEGPRAWVDAFDDYVEDLDAFVRCVRGREGTAPLFVFGHGMGGAIATLWALQRRRTVAGLVLSGAARDGSRPWRPTLASCSSTCGGRAGTAAPSRTRSATRSSISPPPLRARPRSCSTRWSASTRSPRNSRCPSSSCTVRPTS
jgi:alpha-beta hydrolase superfamily lysophospholipase